MKDLSHCVFLVQTDTTVGVLSKDSKKLYDIKKRDKDKPFLISLGTFCELKSFTRVPKDFRKNIRRAKKTTFVYPDKKAIRVVDDVNHKEFLSRFGWQYSTSANQSGRKFDFDYIKDKVDIIIHNPKGFSEKNSSTILQIGNKKIRRLR